MLQGQAMATDTDLVSASVKGSHVETDQSLSPTASAICEGHQPVASCLRLASLRLRDTVEVKVLCKPGEV